MSTCCCFSVTSGAVADSSFSAPVTRGVAVHDGVLTAVYLSRVLLVIALQLRVSVSASVIRLPVGLQFCGLLC